jgi:hypothetical protein
VYFVADGVQTPTPNPRGEKAQRGKPNLYVSHDASVTFVTTLALVDENDWKRSLQTQPTRVSPDGRFLELMSQAPLTGYDNRDRTSGQPAAEVYLYDAVSNGLTCASCEPSGARPAGINYEKLVAGSGGLAGGVGAWQALLVAANVPGWTANGDSGLSARYQPRYLSNSGRVFFNSIDALVPQDSNGTEDVYEFEPAGVGDCTAASVTYAARNGGCVSLISSGSSAQESGFLDASESGDDVFFLTSARLSKLDVDTSRDVYDAHVCTSASPCITFPDTQSPPCTNEASCKPSPTPQPSIFGAPASATFQGPGNATPAAEPPPKPKTAEQISAEKLKRALKACRRNHDRQKRHGCERQARKKARHEGAKKHKVTK